jgi:hypothetical protein
MKRTITFSALLLIGACAMAQKDVGIQPEADYQDAINNVPPTGGIDRTHELMRCLDGWHRIGADRQSAQSAVREPKDAKSILLEIGNSGFPSYNYVRVKDLSITSSYGGEIDLSISPISRVINQVYEERGASLTSELNSNVDDGDCYYLSIYTRDFSRTVVMYGPPSKTATGQLIQKILEAARGRGI